MNDSVCPICGESILPSLLSLHVQLEKTWQRELKETNPEWFSDKNGQARCLEEYKARHARLKKEAYELCAKGENPKLGLGDVREGEIEEEGF